jgi:hypothetical protein
MCKKKGCKKSSLYGGRRKINKLRKKSKLFKAETLYVPTSRKSSKNNYASLSNLPPSVPDSTPIATKVNSIEGPQITETKTQLKSVKDLKRIS